MKNTPVWDFSYEWKAVTCLALGFGLVGLDRWIIGPVFPAMAKDLGLNYATLGSAAGSLALAWGVFAIAAGQISDRLGRRKILLPALILFSLLSGITGLAGGLLSLIAVRNLMGMAEGAYLPTSVAAVAEASHPLHRGRNQGIQLSMFALFGFGIGPIIATQLLHVVPSWRYVFMIVAVPGLILAGILFFVLREPSHLASPASSPHTPWRLIFKTRNTLLAAVGLICAMSCVFVLGALVPSYLTDHHKLSLTTMGFVMSAMGWGGCLGEIAVAGLSDFFGRRLTTVLAFVGALVANWLFFHADADPWVLFLDLSVLSFFGLGLTSILTGPVATEAVPLSLTSSAIGLVSGVGEIFGGGVAPAISGFIATKYGIAQIFWIPTVGLAIGIVVAMALDETAPRRRRI